MSIDKVQAALDQAIASAKSSKWGEFTIPAKEWGDLVMAIRAECASRKDTA